MDDIKVKCARCRHVCLKSDWIDAPLKGQPCCSVKTCPRCGCRIFYDCTPQVAWCWASGLIEVGDVMPGDSSDGSGPIQIATGPEYALEGVLVALARTGRGSGAGQLLVPGVPEADGPAEKLRALHLWLTWCAGRNSAKRNRLDGVVFAAAAGG